MNIIQLADKRYTTKIYDANKKIPDAQLEQLCHFLRNCPSSVNAQPWHFIIISSDEAKQRISPAIMEANRHKIHDASHVVIFCAKTELSDSYLRSVLHREAADGRFTDTKMEQETDGARRYFIGLNSHSPEQLLEWTSKQTYIALGALLFAAAELNIDSTPIEGFMSAQLDEILGLSQQSLTSTVIACLGYRRPDDVNAQLPKSRLSDKEIFTVL